MYNIQQQVPQLIPGGVQPQPLNIQPVVNTNYPQQVLGMQPPGLNLGLSGLTTNMNIGNQIVKQPAPLQNPLLSQNLTQIKQQQQLAPNPTSNLQFPINSLLTFDPQTPSQFSKPLTATQIAAQYVNEFKQQKQIQEVITEEYEKEKKNIKKCDVHSQKPSSNCRQCKKNKELLDEIEEKFKKSLKGMQYQQKEEKNFRPNQDPNHPFPIYGDSTSGNLNALLKNNILNAQYFKDLYQFKSFNEILDELIKKATIVEPWQSGYHGIPSIAFCCIYKFMLMRLTVGQIKYLQEFQGNSIIKCVGHLYIRYCCDPNFMWDWFSKYLLDDEEVRPTNDPKVIMSIGTFIENILTDLNYYSTRLPRIPQKKNREIKALILMMQEKRQRKEENLQKLHIFRPGVYVLVESKQDDEWHPAEVLKLEGKYLRVRYVDYLDVIPRETRTIEELFNQGVIQDQFQEQKIFYGNDESIFISDLEQEDVEDLQRKYQKQMQKLERKQRENQDYNDDGDERKSNNMSQGERANSRSRSQQSSSRKRSRSKSSGSKQSSNDSKKHKRSKSKNRSSNSSQDSRKKSKKHKHHRKRSSKSRSKSHHKKSRSRSYDKHKKSRKDVRGKKQNDDEYKNSKLEKYLAKVDALDKNEALINSKADIRRPTSYKTSLSNPLPKGTSRKLSESPPPIRTHEEFIEVNLPKERKEVKQQQQSKPKKDYQPSREQIEKTKKLLEVYGDASANQAKK